MCLIVVKPNADAKFTFEEHKASLTRNSDGTGIMYVKDNRIVVEKCFGDTKEQLAFFEKHKDVSQYVLHHRFATQGEKSVVNVHPFKILSIDDGDPVDLYFAHNGGFPMTRFNKDHDKKLSDTHLFAIEYLQPIMKQYPDIIDNEIFQIMLHDLIGHSNKLAFMRNDGNTWIFNKSGGDIHNGCWLSNKYSIASATPVRESSFNYGRNHGSNSYTTEDNDPYDMLDGAWYKKNYVEANKIKNRNYETISGLSIDELLTALNEYKDIGVKELEILVMDSPDLVFDMINLLNDKPVLKAILDDKADIIAYKLHALLQLFSKKSTSQAA